MAKVPPYHVDIKMPPLPEVESDSNLSLFDPGNPDVNLFNLVDDELIRLGGSLINYFKFYRDETYDEVYVELRSKPIATESIVVHGHYEPKVLEENLTEFGIELTNDQLFIFNKSYILQKLGRNPIPGDVVLPQFQNQRYEIFQVQEDSFESYGVYHMVCSAKLLRDAPDLQPTPLTEVAPRIGEHI